jgi:hypothetical protein
MEQSGHPAVASGTLVRHSHYLLRLLAKNMKAAMTASNTAMRAIRAVFSTPKVTITSLWVCMFVLMPPNSMFRPKRMNNNSSAKFGAERS